MDLVTFDRVSAELEAEAKGIQKAKRPAYTVGNPDVLHNFKSVAQRIGITPEQVLAVYMLKHVDAVVSILAKPHLPQAEAIIGRFADNINYLHLGYALVKEREVERMPAVRFEEEEELETVGSAGFRVRGKMGPKGR